MHEQTLKCQWISSPEFVMLQEEGWRSSKEGLHVNESELQVKAPVPMSISPVMNAIEWKNIHLGEC